MKTFKNIVTGVSLYALIPAVLLLTAYIITGRNSETIDQAIDYVKENVSSAFKTETDEDQIPLIIAKKEAVDSAVVSEKFVGNIPNHEPEAVINPEVSQIPLEFNDQTFNSDDILEDKLNRLPHDFKVQAELKDRIAFWFDIYTKYSVYFSVIHDQDRPWIIYKIVDARDIYNKRGSLVTKDANERIALYNAKQSVLKTLNRLAKKNSYAGLKGDEYKFYKLLEEVPGNRQKVFRTAAKNYRVQKGQKNFFMKGLVDSSKYMSEMEEIFARYDLPTEIVRLPLVESSFNEDALSKVGASGVWQFMQNIGKQFLHVNEKTDERVSPIKATEAAAQLFLSNHRIFKNWPLTITAYNHGTGIIKTSKKLKTNDLSEIIKKNTSKSFGFASQNFYCEFMAALYAEKYQEEIFGLLVKPAPLAADSIKLRKSMRIKEIAEIAGVTLEEIKLHNPDIKKLVQNGNPHLPVGYKIRLPLGRSSRLELYYQQMEVMRAANKKGAKRSS